MIIELNNLSLNNVIPSTRVPAFFKPSNRFQVTPLYTLLPIVTVLGLQLGSLLAGTVITETVFAWDGIGRLLVESIEKRDYPVTQACVLVIALTYVFVNLLTDIIYTRIDPRVRFSS